MKKAIQTFQILKPKIKKDMKLNKKYTSNQTL